MRNFRLNISFGVLACVSLFVGMDSFAGTTESVLPTSGTKIVSLASNPGDDNILIMDSPSSGTWRFRAYGSPMGWDGCYTGDHVVFTYWKDNNDPNGDWNEWPGGGGLCWPTSGWSTILYSGGSNISYKFVYKNYVGFPDIPYGQTVYGKFIKL